MGGGKDSHGKHLFLLGFIYGCRENKRRLLRHTLDGRACEETDILSPTTVVALWAFKRVPYVADSPYGMPRGREDVSQHPFILFHL